MPRADKPQSWPWSVPVAVEAIAETGQHFELVADDRARAGVAHLAGLRGIRRLSASFDVTRSGSGGLRVAGRVSATVGQACVVTLEPVSNEIEEDVDLIFQPGAATPAQPDGEMREGPEPLIGGEVDLGAIATEFLILGLDPYPRAPGAQFEAPHPAGEEAAGPFSALAKLKQDRERDG
jgi:uncharacterized metal-binding protein YceD (DUF177 family)